MKKSLFLNDLGLLFGAREKAFNSFKIRLFPTKNLDKIPARKPTPEPATDPEVAKEPATEPEVAKESTKSKKANTKRKISSLKLGENFLNEVKNEEKNEKIFHEFCNYHSPPFLVKDLYEGN